MDASDRARLRATLAAYDGLTQSGRALTVGQARRRAELLVILCELTGVPPSQARRRARSLLKTGGGHRGHTPKGGRSTRYRGVTDLAPQAATPQPHDAVRITQIVPTAIETKRRNH